MGKRALIEESSTSSGAGVPAKKRGKPLEWGKLANHELTFDLENEANLSIIEISSNTTVSEEAPKSVQSEEAPKGEKVKEKTPRKKAAARRSQHSCEDYGIPANREERTSPYIGEETHAPKKDTESTFLQRNKEGKKRREVTSC